MSVSTLTIGNPRDGDLPGFAQGGGISRRKLETVHDLLLALDGHKHLSMLRTTAGHLGRCLKAPPEEVAIEALVRVAPRFRTYLKESHYKDTAARAYRYYARMLLQLARELGWMPRHPEVAEFWKPILSAVMKALGCSGIVRYAISLERAPREFGEEDLNAWTQMMLREGRDFRYVRDVKWRFRRALSRAGLMEQLPCLHPAVQRLRYGVPVHLLPKRLHTEVEALVKWKQIPYAEGRPLRSRLREISAIHLRGALTRLYGFVTTVLPTLPGHKRTRPVRTLVDLVTKDSIGSYIRWLLNERKLLGESVIPRLALIQAAMKQHPDYKTHDFRWLADLIKGIPRAPESERRARKERKYLRYETAVEIPRKIHEARGSAANLTPKKLALLVRNELLISWLLVLPWRPLNIRKCRIGSHAEGANLFKGEISELINIEKPHWVEERIVTTPDEPFWQFHFRESETKNGREVHAVVPHQLIPLLEEYSGHHRQVLLDGRPDPGTLFFNEAARPLPEKAITDLVGSLTQRYAQRRVTPHLFRDILAFWWLRNHPKDYLTLSKLLWHRNVAVTIDKYGCKFDESHAVVALEEWLTEWGWGQKKESECARLAVSESGGILKELREFVSREESFKALNRPSQVKGLSSISEVIEAHPWLAKLIGASLEQARRREQLNRSIENVPLGNVASRSFPRK